jgi:hypothetical protein
MGEIYPVEFKAFGMGMGAACNWIGVTATTFITLATSNLTIYTVFYSVSFVALLFTIFLIRETKCKSVHGSPYFTGPVTIDKSGCCGGK